MPRTTPTVERAMEVQVAIRDLRSATHPLYEAALASNDWNLLAECRALSATLKAAAHIARRIARFAEPGPRECADGLLEPGHGAAA